MIEKPSLSEIFERVEKDLATQAVPYSFKSQLAKAISGMSFLLHTQVEIELKKLLPMSADGEELDRWANFFGCKRINAKNARVLAAVEFSKATALDQGMLFSVGGKNFSLLSGTEIQLNHAVLLEATEYFEDEITVDSALSPLETMPYFTHGNLVKFFPSIAKEADSNLRNRLMFALQNPTQGGSYLDYLVWMMRVDGVKRAFVWASDANIYFSYIDKDNLQSEKLSKFLLEHLKSLAPIGANVIFYPLNFTDLSGSLEFDVTPSHLKDKCQAAIKSWLMATYTPRNFRSIESFKNGESKVSSGEIFLSDISKVIASVAGHKSHRLMSTSEIFPTSDGVFYV